MRGVKIGNIHTWDDFSLILLPYEIESPEVKKQTVAIEGANSELDLTEYFGDVFFQNRLITLSFQTKTRGTAFKEMYSNMTNIIHGQKLRIIFDDDPEYYFYGRVEVDSFRSSSKLGEVVITIDAEPYKYKLSETVVSEVIVNSKAVNFFNLRKKVVPVITTSAPINLLFNEVEYSLTAGTWTVTGIIFNAGINTILFTGDATITVRYQEGGL